jgi:catechol 2,3-dioxygenase-like lactoylglutathione lyase family enzyme
MGAGFETVTPEEIMATAGFTGLSRIGQIAIVVHDLAKALAFYRDVLGMKFLFEVPGMAFFDCGGVRLMLGLAPRAELDHPASILYYKVDDIQAAYEALKARGVTFVGVPHLLARMPDHELWLAEFRDMEDNFLALMSEVRPA